VTTGTSAPATMSLADLLTRSREIPGALSALAPLTEVAAADVAIGDVVNDSRHAGPGTMFVAIPPHGPAGVASTMDGRRYIGDAFDAGAEALIVGLLPGESPVDLPGLSRWMAAGKPVYSTADGRRDLAALAFTFAGRPDLRTKLVGITGTNGKSTTVALVRQLARGCGRRAAELGTLGWRIDHDAYQDTGHTTPGAVPLARLLKLLVDREGVEVLAMEVSSHAIDQHRVAGLRFAACLFSNLTQDHLDYHGSMEHYGQTKRSWSPQARLDNPDVAIVTNMDDALGRAIAADHAQPANRLFTYGLESRHRPRLSLDNIEAIQGGTRARLKLDGQIRMLEYPLLGRFNAQNVLCALGACLGIGLNDGELVRELAFAQPPPGRFQRVDAGQPFTIIVDFAHTPDALERVLINAREMQRGATKRDTALQSGAQRTGTGDQTSITANRIIAVFGCGGDRDRGKRPLMGEVAARLADVAFLTSDNPRSEDPMTILRHIESGVVDRPGLETHLIADRREAIQAAIRAARPGDTVLILGKGHEAYQEIHGQRTPFNDIAVATDAVRAC